MRKKILIIPFAFLLFSCGKGITTKSSTTTNKNTDATTTTQTTPIKDKEYNNVLDLITDKENEIFSLLSNFTEGVFESATGANYDARNIIFSAVDVDETATTLTQADYTFAYKTGETERKYVTATAYFSEVSLSDLAEGKTSNFTLENVSRTSQQAYDAKEKQNDTKFLSSLYEEEHDKVIKEYEKEEFEDELIIIASVEQLIAEHGEEAYDTIMNSDFYENNIVKKVYGRYYGTDYLTINDVDIDFGSTSADGKIHDLTFRVYFTYKNGVGAVQVNKLTLANGIEYADILEETKLNVSNCTFSNVYSFTYTPAEQGTRSALMQAIANVAVNDGFEYSADDILFVQQGDTTDSNLGSVSDFRLSINTNKGIRQLKVFVAKASSDEGLVNQINNGRYKVCEYLESANFTDNFILNSQEIENGI